jgi:hypothetical protein
MSDNTNGAAPQHHGVERLTQGAHQAVDRFAGAAGQIADTLAVNSEQLKGLPARVGGACRAQVRDHPLATLGLAVAAGFALSWLMRAR